MFTFLSIPQGTWWNYGSTWLYRLAQKLILVLWWHLHFKSTLGWLLLCTSAAVRKKLFVNNSNPSFHDVHPATMIIFTNDCGNYMKDYHKCAHLCRQLVCTDASIHKKFPEHSLMLWRSTKFLQWERCWGGGGGVVHNDYELIVSHYVLKGKKIFVNIV